MHDTKRPADRNIIESATSSLIVLAFGILALAFLVVIDRPEWFQIRPASGAAAAMANASTKVAVEEPRAF